VEHRPGLDVAPPGIRDFCASCLKPWPCRDAICRNCGHVLGQHGSDFAIYGCCTPVRAALSPYRRVVCPCHRFEYGQPTSIALPPLPAPPEDEIAETLTTLRAHESVVDRLLGVLRRTDA